MRLLLLLSCIAFSNVSITQSILYSKAVKITFLSKAPLEDIEAKNNNAVSIWNLKTGAMEFSVLMKGFEFKKALMQQHFNEKYVESDQYPKAIFKGSLADPKNISLENDGVYRQNIKGILTIHGVSQQVTVPVVITVKTKLISATADFVVAPADYKIKIPAIVANNISKSIAVRVYVPSYQLLER